MKIFGAIIRFEGNCSEQERIVSIRFNALGTKDPVINCIMKPDMEVIDKNGNWYQWSCTVQDEYADKATSTRKFKIVEGEKVVGHGIVST